MSDALRHRGFVPLSEIHNIESVRISWQLEVPDYIPADEIGIHFRRLERLSRMAGFGHIAVSSFVGNRTSYTPEIEGYGPDGSAYSSLKGSKTKVPLQKSDTENDMIDDFTYVALPDTQQKGRIAINSSELTDRLQKSKKEGALRSPREWASILDTAVTDGIVGLSDEKHIKSHQRNRLEYMGFTMALGVFYSAVSTDASVAEAMIRQHIIMGMAVSPFLTKLEGRMPSFSMIAGYNLDRALAVRGLAKTQTLVKALP